jgi:hypothetical protein
MKRLVHLRNVCCIEIENTVPNPNMELPKFSACSLSHFHFQVGDELHHQPWLEQWCLKYRKLLSNIWAQMSTEIS